MKYEIQLSKRNITQHEQGDKEYEHFIDPMVWQSKTTPGREV